MIEKIKSSMAIDAEIDLSSGDDSLEDMFPGGT